MNTLKKTLVLLLCAAMTVPAFSCGEKIDPANESSNVQTDADGNTVAENNEGGNNGEGDSQDGGSNNENNGGGNNEDGNNGGGNNGGGNGGGNSGNGGAAPQLEVVTDKAGQKNYPLVFEQPKVEDDKEAISTIKGDDGKVYVQKQDINGNPVTEAGGEPVTEIYTGATNAAEYEKGYEPSITSYQAFWLDISECEDFVFNGDLLEFEIEISKDAKDGVYPVECYYGDFSNYSANTDENSSILKNVAFRPGYICINSEQPETPQLGSEMTLTPETISAKPGDTVRLKVRIDNNPGIVAFVIRMHYDQNIMKIVNAGAGKALGDLAKLTTRTLDE